MTTINNENVPPNEKRVIDDLQDGFCKPYGSFVGTKRTRISRPIIVAAGSLGSSRHPSIGPGATLSGPRILLEDRTRSLPIVKTPLPYVRDSFLLENVLSPTECDRLIASAELAGYRPDEPLGGQPGGSIFVDHGIYNATGIVRDERRRSLRQVSDEPDEDMPLLPPPHTIPFPGGRCPSFNHAQKEEAELLKAYSPKGLGW